MFEVGLTAPLCDNGSNSERLVAEMLQFFASSRRRCLAIKVSSVPWSTFAVLHSTLFVLILPLSVLSLFVTVSGLEKNRGNFETVFQFSKV